jgi:hypothetical protein
VETQLHTFSEMVGETITHVGFDPGKSELTLAFKSGKKILIQVDVHLHSKALKEVLARV